MAAVPRPLIHPGSWVRADGHSAVATDSVAIVLPSDEILLLTPQVLEQEYGIVKLEGGFFQACNGHGVSRLTGASQLALHLFQTIGPRQNFISASTRALTAVSFRHRTDSCLKGFGRRFALTRRRPTQCIFKPAFTL